MDNDDNSKFVEIKGEYLLHPEGYVMIEGMEVEGIKYREIRDGGKGGRGEER